MGIARYTPLIRQRQEDLCEFKGSLAYIAVPGQPGMHIETLHQTKQNESKTKVQNLCQLGVIAPSRDPSTWEAETGEMR